VTTSAASTGTLPEAQKRYGFWRPVIGTTVEKFLACGDLKEGFAASAARRAASSSSSPSNAATDPLDLIAELGSTELAEVTQHIPDARKHLGRAFGFHSNKARGRRAQASGAHGDTVAVDDQLTPNTTHARRRWAALI
jgi:hypothetical protein